MIWRQSFRVLCLLFLAMSFSATAFGQSVSAVAPASENVQGFVDHLFYVDLTSIQAAGLMSSTLPVSPWSDHYWGYSLGGLAERYADPDFPFSSNWKTNAEYLYSSLLTKPVALLSPAEKYDLLVGDTNATLTKFMLNKGREAFDQTGTVESWLGICHGWSAAAMSLPRPRKVVMLTAADGVTQIPFYPTDIKSLGSALYANSVYEARMIGSFCGRDHGDLDGAGRIQNPECFDVNPATWHLSVVNQIGYSKRSLIMDARYDREIWNQPVLSYSYKYFNPVSGTVSTRLQESAVPIAQIPADRFRAYRSPYAAYVVGIAMDVVYVDESLPNHRPTDSYEEDSTSEIRYYYDLELNSAGIVIGGEWHQERHPDVLWLPSKSARPSSAGDPYLAEAAWISSFPRAWTPVAQYASGFGQPLARVVYALFSLSSG